MRRFGLLSVYTTILCFFALSLPSRGEPLSLPPVIVTAPRVNPFLLQSNFATTASIDATVAIRYATVTQLLQTFPSITLRQWGSEGHWSTVSIRGASAKQVAIHIDAVPVLSPSGIVDLSELPLPLFSNVTVLRGIHNGSKGANAVGGVLAFDTTTEPLRFFTRYGSFGTFQGGLSAPLSLPMGQLNVALSGLRSTGAFYFLNNQNTPANPNDDAYMPLSNNDVSSWHGLVRYSGREDNAPEFQLWGSVIDNGLAGAIGRLTRHTRLSVGRYRLHTTWHVTPVSTGSLYFENRRQLYSDPEGEFFGSPYQSSQTMSQFGSTYHLPIQLGDIPIKTDFRLGLITLEDDQFGRPTRWSVETTFQADRPWGESTFSGSVNLGYYSDAGLQPAGSVGIWAPILESITLKGNLGTAIRLPTFSEKYSQYAFFRANPNLRPETAVEVDTGLVYDAAGWTWEATYFSRWMRELIETTVVSVWIQSQNISAAHVHGIELSGATTWGSLHWMANAILQQGQNVTPGSTYGAPLRDFPPAKAALQTKYTFSSEWSAYTDLTWTSERSISFYAALPSQTQLDFTLVWQFSLTQLVGLSVRNVLDNTAQDQYGFPLPGRSVSIQTSWTL